MSFFKYLDPYYPLDKFIEYLHKKNIQHKALDITLFILYSLILAILILELLGLVLQTSEPMMTVVTGSMIPNLNIGDVVVLTKATDIKTTEIFYNGNLDGKKLYEFAEVNYDIENKEIETKNIDINGQVYDIKQEGNPIVYFSPLLKRKIIHRAIFKIVAEDGNYYLTKGDNVKTNKFIDQDCGKTILVNGVGHNIGCITPLPIKESEIIGKFWFKIPYIGYIKILPANMFGFS
jgi:signal peptidase I